MPLIPLADRRNTGHKTILLHSQVVCAAISVLLTSDFIKWRRFICES